ncbi:hypothetical protein [Kibdelosporangium philippinense]|uniref:hypothetical protein n=1 Tax=Kibdelosporangium philippinense TaxID=211113 RepID=UPI00361B9B2E
MSLPGLDLEKLRGKLGDGPLSAEIVEGGRSNLTYVVTDGTQKWVGPKASARTRAADSARHGP